jgi:hypothetical protein
MKLNVSDAPREDAWHRRALVSAATSRPERGPSAASEQAPASNRRSRKRECILRRAAALAVNDALPCAPLQSAPPGAGANSSS